LPDLPLLADGAMGAELQARSGFAGLPARLNLIQPELVLGLHREYVAAGARLLVANTLGGTAEEIAAGVALARQAVPANPRPGPLPGEVGIVVAASIASPDDAEASEGADAVIFETLTSLAGLEHAARGGEPVLATFSFGADGRLDGLTPAEVARRVAGLGLAAWGYGCGFGPEAAASVLAALRQAAPEAVLIAKPNLGLPPYPIAPAQMAVWARDMAALGVNIIGACCGSTPEHIRAMAAALVDYV
jgi:5-methyltetrahydrofolate--homocysteine methyltransferase